MTYADLAGRLSLADVTRRMLSPVRLLNDVMVASASGEFADSVTDALAQEGAFVVCVETMDGAMEALEDGFRPDALVLDGVLPFGPALVAHLRGLPKLRQLHVVAASPLRAPGALPSRRVTLVKRHDLSAVIEALADVLA